MSTKYFSDGEVHRSFNPFDSPFEAFINYMNVLSDFKLRLDSVMPETKVGKEVAALQKIIDKKDARIKKLEADIKQLKKKRLKK
jgi:alpha-amylase